MMKRLALLISIFSFVSLFAGECPCENLSDDELTAKGSCPCGCASGLACICIPSNDAEEGDAAENNEVLFIDAPGNYAR